MDAFHPQVVHFAIALLFVGVPLRALSLIGRPAFVGPAAATLLLLGTLAAVAAAYTGDLAHGPVEQMPGLRPAVEAHETWGERARNIFFIVVVIEIAALALRRSPRRQQALIASTVVGVVGLGVLYQAAGYGGDIVYSYGGGVGTRSGRPEDVNHLLLAGLYQQALADRQAGRAAEAAALIDVASQRFPSDPEVQLIKAESTLLDRKDPTAALEALRAIAPPSDNRALRVRHGLLTADALVAAGQRDGAIAMLQQLQSSVDSPRIQERLDTLQTR